MALDIVMYTEMNNKIDKNTTLPQRLFLSKMFYI